MVNIKDNKTIESEDIKMTKTYTISAPEAIRYLEEVGNYGFADISATLRREFMKETFINTLFEGCSERKSLKGLAFEKQGDGLIFKAKTKVLVKGESEEEIWNIPETSKNQDMILKVLEYISRKNILFIEKRKKGLHAKCRGTSKRLSKELLKENGIDWEKEGVVLITRVDSKWVKFFKDGTSKNLNYNEVKTLTGEEVVKVSIIDGAVALELRNGDIIDLPNEFKSHKKFLVSNLLGEAVLERVLLEKEKTVEVEVPVLEISNPQVTKSAITFDLKADYDLLSDENIIARVGKSQISGFVANSIHMEVPEMEQFMLDELRERSLEMWNNILPKKLKSTDERLLAEFVDTMRKYGLITIDPFHAIYLARIYKMAENVYPLFKKLSKSEKVNLLKKAYSITKKEGDIYKIDIFSFAKYTLKVMQERGLHKEINLSDGRNYFWVMDRMNYLREDPMKLASCWFTYSTFNNKSLSIHRELNANDMWLFLVPKENGGVFAA